MGFDPVSVLMGANSGGGGGSTGGVLVVTYTAVEDENDEYTVTADHTLAEITGALHNGIPINARLILQYDGWDDVYGLDLYHSDDYDNAEFCTPYWLTPTPSIATISRYYLTHSDSEISMELEYVTLATANG